MQCLILYLLGLLDASSTDNLIIVPQITMNLHLYIVLKYLKLFNYKRHKDET